MNQPLEHSHDPEAIAIRLAGKTEHSYLRDFVYGAIDGIVTTFAVVSSVAGAGLSSEIVIVLGLANLISDGFSMAASNFLGTRADEQLRDKARAMEQRHIRQDPDGERQEIRQIFVNKGFTGDDLEGAVSVITSDEKRWIDMMLVEELGMQLDGPSPIRAALTTFVAFCVAGVLPLLAFLFGFIVPVESASLFIASTLITAVAFFAVGATKSFFVDQHWASSGGETLMIGGIAALLAYLVGLLLKGIV